MDEKDERDDQAGRWFDEDMAETAGMTGMVIGRIMQLTGMPGIPLTRAWFGSRRTALPSGRIVSIPVMFNLYVYRQDGQPWMILTRVDPFQCEHVPLSELEMEVIMRWAKQAYIEHIGTFAPSDGGWLWWRK